MEIKKAIYGLKQSSRLWNKKLSQALQDMQLKQSQTDPCIYFKHEGKQRLIIGIYVDDILILSNNNKFLKYTKQKLAETFKTKDLGKARKLLGLHITRDEQRGKI